MYQQLPSNPLLQPYLGHMRREFLQYYVEYMEPLLRTHLALLEIVGLSRDRPRQLNSNVFTSPFLVIMRPA